MLYSFLVFVTEEVGMKEAQLILVRLKADGGRSVVNTSCESHQRLGFVLIKQR